MSTLPFSQRPTETPRAGHRDEAMFEFDSESPFPKSRPSTRKPMAWFAGAVTLAVLTGVGIWVFRTNMASAPAEGTLRVESEPSGAAVEVNGSLRGLTPLTLTLPIGAHAVVVNHEAQKHEIAASITQNTQSVHHVRFTSASPTLAALEPQRARLHVTSDAADAMITVDGVERGVVPVTIEGLEAGEHQVLIRSGGKTQRRMVTLVAGANASLVVTTAPPAADSGWMSAKTSAPLEIFESGKLVGTTDIDRIMLSAGQHNLEFVAADLGFRARRSVTITPGQTTTVAVSLPQAPVNLNAVPWAEVSIDGVDSGQTPIANQLLTIGPHVIEFRHPDLGTKRVRIVVSLTEPARVAVDMRAR